MKDFLTRNFVLVLGISLPILLIAALLLVHGISRLTATRPAYPVLYVSFDDYFGQQFYDFEISDGGRLEIGYVSPEENASTSAGQPPAATLALYDAASDTLDTFRLEAPEGQPDGLRTDLAVPEALSGLTFSDQNVAPDGYRLEFSTYRSGGLLREIFGTGSRSRHHRLIKDGVSFPVPDVAGTSYAYHEAFVGWVIDQQEESRREQN